MGKSFSAMSLSASSEVLSRAAWTIVGDPDDLRVRLFSAALGERGVRPSIVDYRALFDHTDAIALHRDSIVRIESPGRASDLYLRFLALGAERASVTVPHEGSDWASDRGRILWPNLWYLGFSDVVSRIGARLRNSPVRCTSHPEDIVKLFDKRACHRFLSEHGVPVPPAIVPAGSFDEVRSAIRCAGWSRAFIKLRHGSSASGIVAYERSPQQEWAYTTVEVVRDALGIRLYNTRRVRRLHSAAEIAEVVDELCRYEVHVERWIPKAGLDGATCDLRVLVVAGRPAHAVVRLANGPITNLHLLNRRADVGLLRSRVSESTWNEICDTCERVGALFPRSLHVALDIAVTPDLRKHFVLEVNAFGDLLKGVTHVGRTTHQLEVDAVYSGWRS
jgi:hypothetical protein